LRDLVTGLLETERVPGLAAGLVGSDGLVRADGYGWASVDGRIPLTSDTVMSVASVSKTITATAVAQLLESETIELDGDVSDYVGFEVRNPRFPGVVVTIRSLLVHRASIRDGSHYEGSYGCGDSQIGLGAWLREYLTPGGGLYDPDANFHAWEPGYLGEVPADPRPYSNVGFGLLGYVVEATTGVSFRDYCSASIFDPLSMGDTSWGLAGVDPARIAVPYTCVQSDGSVSEGSQSDFEKFGSRLALDASQSKVLESGGYFAHCHYSTPTYPDGGLRTTISDLCKFLRIYIAGGAPDGVNVLHESSVRRVLTRQHSDRGLCWSVRDSGYRPPMWFHAGFDPGVLAFVCVFPSLGIGVAVAANAHMPAEKVMSIVRALKDTSEQ